MLVLPVALGPRSRAGSIEHDHGSRSGTVRALVNRWGFPPIRDVLRRRQGCVDRAPPRGSGRRHFELQGLPVSVQNQVEQQLLVCHPRGERDAVGMLAPMGWPSFTPCQALVAPAINSVRLNRRFSCSTSRSTRRPASRVTTDARPRAFRRATSRTRSTRRHGNRRCCCRPAFGAPRLP